MKKTLISGVKPTGRPHIGNYFGAMRQFVDLQDKYDSHIFIADLHALTTVQKADELNSNIIEQAIDYLAIGLDPQKVTLFKQSDVPQVTELCWVFNCLTTMPYLMRAHGYKDAEAKDKEINVGIFDYPMLMAADILLSDAEVVPVGKDQKQHVEFTRDTAEKFNRIYGETFKVPESIILEDVATVPGTDGQKMSKSYGNTIPLFATREEIEKAVMSISTDSSAPDEPKDPETNNIYKIHSLFISPEERAELERKYRSGIGYKDAKEQCIEAVDSFIKPLRERREKISKDRAKVVKILKKGGKVMNKKVEKKMEEIRSKIGINI